MTFSVGDNVVHPHHGPGTISAVEQRELLDGKKQYFIIEIPASGLTAYVPRRKLAQIGVRAAISRSKLPSVMSKLGSRPQRLPKDYKERQELVGERLRTGKTLKVAAVLRDLAWHKHRGHLTKKDTDQFRQGRDRLASELALVLGSEISDMEQMIDDALEVSIVGVRQPTVT
jgi:CarD family transcriptional regulator